MYIRASDHPAVPEHPLRSSTGAYFADIFLQRGIGRMGHTYGTYIARTQKLLKNSQHQWIYFEVPGIKQYEGYTWYQGVLQRD